ncbi:MAG: extracellular solute-binding protein [Clostridia bacterium]|nr:extracellular solute-binding protein [Clostridia bacterium]
MKKTIILLLVIALFLIPVSCKEESGLLATPSPIPVSTSAEQETNLPVFERPKDDGAIHLYAVDMPFRHMFAEDSDEWEEYMLERHGIQVELEYITLSSTPASRNSDYLDLDYGIVVDELRYLQEFNGFVVINDNYSLAKLMDSGLIIPVNEFIPDIHGYVDLPDEILASYTDKDGNIWGLPTSDDISLPRRIYNKEWLDAYGMGEPKSIDELYEFARYIAFEDPDGNGVDDTYIAAFSDVDIMNSLADIFIYLGCQHAGFYPVTYDPGTGEYISACETEAFKEAIAFIGMMVQQGLLMRDVRWSDTLHDPESLDYKLATVMGATFYPEYFNGYIIGEYWPGNDGKSSIPIWVEQRGLAVLKDTAGVTDKFNKLYDIAESGIDGYMDLRAGIAGKTYEIEQDYIYFKTITPDGEDLPRINLDMGIARNKGNELPVIVGEYQMSLHESGRMIADEIKETNIALLGSSSVFSIPLMKDSYKLWKIRRYIIYPFFNLIGNILDSNYSIEEALQIYNEGILAAGVIDIFDKINGGAGE